MRYKTVRVKSDIPDARYKDVRARVTRATLDEDGNIVGFDVWYSTLHGQGAGWVRFGEPFCDSTEAEDE